MSSDNTAAVFSTAGELKEFSDKLMEDSDTEDAAKTDELKAVIKKVSKQRGGLALVNTLGFVIGAMGVIFAIVGFADSDVLFIIIGLIGAITGGVVAGIGLVKDYKVSQVLLDAKNKLKEIQEKID